MYIYIWGERRISFLVINALCFGKMFYCEFDSVDVVRVNKVSCNSRIFVFGDTVVKRTKIKVYRFQYSLIINTSNALPNA